MARYVGQLPAAGPSLVNPPAGGAHLIPWQIHFPINLFKPNSLGYIEQKVTPPPWADINIPTRFLSVMYTTSFFFLDKCTI